MHRLLMNPSIGMEVDHINGDKLDNRKANLRICSHAENRRNVKKQMDCTSEYKGVFWCSRLAKWSTRITVNGKEIHLGNYQSEVVAALHYDMASRILHGVFGCGNFDDETFAALWDEYGAIIMNPKKCPGTSRYVGVAYEHYRGGWVSFFAYKGKRHWVGCFATEEEAHDAYVKARGDFFSALSVEAKGTT